MNMNRKVEGKAKSNPPIVGPVGEAGEAGKVKFHPTQGRIGESEQGSRFVIGPGNRLALEFGDDSDSVGDGQLARHRPDEDANVVAIFGTGLDPAAQIQDV
jgi:hypothetical protein